VQTIPPLISKTHASGLSCLSFQLVAAADCFFFLVHRRFVQENSDALKQDPEFRREIQGNSDLGLILFDIWTNNSNNGNSSTPTVGSDGQRGQKRRRVTDNANATSVIAVGVVNADTGLLISDATTSTNSSQATANANGPNQVSGSNFAAQAQRSTLQQLQGDDLNRLLLGLAPRSFGTRFMSLDNNTSSSSNVTGGFASFPNLLPSSTSAPSTSQQQPSSGQGFFSTLPQGSSNNSFN
jgi:hypothetical protein